VGFIGISLCTRSECLLYILSMLTLLEWIKTTVTNGSAIIVFAYILYIYKAQNSL
jgi:hypothetical protein